jgi:hypothetical protein
MSDRLYNVRVRVTIEVGVQVEARDAREASHRAASRALDSLEGLGERPRVIDHEIISTRARPVL